MKEKKSCEGSAAYNVFWSMESRIRLQLEFGLKLTVVGPIRHMILNSSRSKVTLHTPSTTFHFVYIFVSCKQQKKPLLAYSMDYRGYFVK